MAVKIRLHRAGTKKSPYYWIVSIDSRRSRDGLFLEKIGTYDPRKDPAEVKVKPERLEHWLNNGATMTGIVHQILKKNGLLKPAAKPAEPQAAAAEN